MEKRLSRSEAKKVLFDRMAELANRIIDQSAHNSQSQYDAVELKNLIAHFIKEEK